MPNLLDNGAFDEGLNDWTATGSILRSDGYPRVGCVQLDAGETVYQLQDLPADQLHTLHYFYKLTTGGTLTAAYGSGVTQAHVGGAQSVWREGVLAFALDANANENVQFSAAGAACYVDTVTMLVGGLPISRAEIASRAARRIAALATAQSLSTTASASGPEGDYSDAIDDALRKIGAVNHWGDPDVTCLPANKVSSAIDATVAAMLETLRITYSLESDVTLGPRSERRSQIAGMLGDLQGGGATASPVEVRQLIHPEFD